jgi:cysteine-rich repeat protein
MEKIVFDFMCFGGAGLGLIFGAARRLAAAAAAPPRLAARAATSTGTQAAAPTFATALAWAALVLAVAQAGPAHAQGIADKTAVLPRQPLAMPAVGVAVADPVFGTTLRRFTGQTASGGYGTPIYSQLQAFSDDNAYVLLNENDEYVVRRMADRSLVTELAVEWNAPRWQPAAPRTIVHYDTNADTTVRIQHTTVDPVATTTVFTMPATYDRVLVNQSFDEVSRDGRWMGGMVTRTSDNAGVLFAVDLEQQRMTVAIPVPTLYAGPCDPDPQWGQVEPDWVGVSPLGRYLVVQWPRDGTERCSGLETFDIETGAFVGRVYDGHQHGDLGVLPDGNTEFFMTFELWSPEDPSRPAIAWRALPGNATVSAPNYLTVVDWGGGHISCQGPDGVCLVSYGSWDGDGWTPFEKEEFLQFTDGSVLRLAHHRSSECGYWVQPRATISRDGSLALFASDWADERAGDGCSGGDSLGRGEAWLIEVPGAFAACGNGELDAGESCDDGNSVAGDGCDPNCTPTGCGNGYVSAGEDCDDGNAVDDDCCSNACVAAPAATSCDDGDVCNGVAICDGAGSCIAGSALDCDDADPCTLDTCDASAGCASQSVFELVCAAPAKAAVKIDDRAKPKLAWKWQAAGGDVGDFGDPTDTDGYALCVRDWSGGAPGAVFGVRVEAGAGWRGRSSGFQFKDNTGFADGIEKVALKADGSKTKLALKGAGAALPLPGPSASGAYFDVEPQVQTRLVADNGMCWEAVFAAPKRNDGSRFEAR